MDQDLGTDWLSLLDDRASTRTFAAGEIISLQDEALEYVGYILTGQARAISYSQEGEATWLGYFESGSFFGHMSLLTQRAASFEISAETDMEVRVIAVSTMRELLEQKNRLGQVLAHNLAQRLDMMMRRLIEALTLSAKGRVCAELVRLSKWIGVDPDKQIIRPSPVFVDVALRVSSTRETVSRTVSDLQKRGIVSREPGALVIIKPAQLKAAIR